MTCNNSHLLARLRLNWSENILKSPNPLFRAAGIWYAAGKGGSFAQEIYNITRKAAETLSSPCSIANLLRTAVLSHQQFLIFIITPVSFTLFVIILPLFLNVRCDRSALRCQGCVTLAPCHPLRNSAPNINFNSTSGTSGLSQTQHAFPDAGVWYWWGSGMMNHAHSRRSTPLMQYLCFLLSVRIS